MTTSREVELLNGSVILRPHEDGSFDELLFMEGEHCLVHAEMMNDKTLWISFSPPGYEAGERVVMWVTIKGRKLEISAEED